eukprot:TRINITY_DN19291_c0_g1_i13.p2 TRINITY_DN19291_c0_g1~~TRINITY_DN19291_c0_g1_i13.p2  ORF type:complete len:218 (-),score=31.40 TRINITY_DN19291_c0_g1_i13:529-1182(-)
MFEIQKTIRDDASKAATDIAPHPSGQFFVTSYEDGRWSFNDVSVGECLVTLEEGTPGSGYMCAGFHPDGLIFALGCNTNEIHIWEMRNRSLAAKFQGHEAMPGCVSFSENGVHMATADAAGSILLWDLRKYQTFQKINPYQGNEAVRGLVYDKSGRYLACTGSESTKIYGIKQDYGLLCAQQGLRQPGGIGLKFQANATQLIVGGGAGEIMVLGEAS